MSYSRENELFKNELKKEGLDSKKYGLHSLRSGGASTAASLGSHPVFGAIDLGWQTASAKNNYIDVIVYINIIRQCELGKHILLLLPPLLDLLPPAHPSMFLRYLVVY
jgi:hypothetical protein